jgi:hypothetical protein
MLQASIVADYLDVLGRELGYAPLLSRRVRLEVEDHLWEAAANEGGDAAEAQRRAVEKFGDPQEIARQYAAIDLQPDQTRCRHRCSGTRRNFPVNEGPRRLVQPYAMGI